MKNTPILKLVPLEKIRVNPFQPRSQFDEENLKELADSIKAVGLIHPPTVRPLEVEDEYELVSGERRYRASKMAGLKAIPVVISSSDDSLSAKAALIENIQRVDLNPLEIAKAFKNLSIEFSLNQEELSEQVGKKRSTVSNYLRLLSLPDKIQEGLKNNVITMGHAKAILALSNMEQQIQLYERVVREELSVREAENAANKMLGRKKNEPKEFLTRDFYLEQIADKIQYLLGTKVSIQGSSDRGRLQIEYFSLDDLNRILDKFEVNL